MPLTAPPRRAPDPHSRMRGCAVATPQRSAAVSRGSSSSRNGHDSGPWKMLPPGMFTARSMSSVVLVSMHGRPAASVMITVSIGSASTEFSEASTAACSRARSSSLFSGVASRCGNVQPEHGERLGSGCRELGREDRRVAQRVAVDLAGQRVRDVAGCGGRVGVTQLRAQLVDVEGAAERRLGGDGGVAQPRQPAEQQVDLHLGALRGRQVGRSTRRAGGAAPPAPRSRARRRRAPRARRRRARTARSRRA